MWRSWARGIHPRPPARHRAAERRDPPPWPAARAWRAQPSSGWRGRGVAAGAPCSRPRVSLSIYLSTPASCAGRARPRAGL
eukprot:scaffold24023_cov62-Phaeocystis_antarctica.AAC.2